jgi:tetratricopeptide (TPR) repeat protein
MIQTDSTPAAATRGRMRAARLRGPLAACILAWGSAALAGPATPDAVATDATNGDGSAVGADAAIPASDLPSLDIFRYGSSQPEGQDSLARQVNLGSIQQRNGEYAAAIETFESALDGIEDAHGVWDLRNVEALAGLGAAYRGLGRYDEAIDYYERALYINRMNLGLHDTSQIPMLDELTATLAEIDQWERANEIQEYVFYVQQRAIGARSPAILPALYRMAEWYRKTGGIYQARALYEDAVEIIEGAYGPEDIRLVEALHGIAMTYRLERYPLLGEGPEPPKDEEFAFATANPAMRELDMVTDSRATVNRFGAGERALIRAVEIYDKHPGIPARERVEALLNLGDWFLIFDKWNPAFETYSRARDLLLADGWEPAEVTALFADPLPLVFPLPPGPGAPASGSVERMRGYIDISYDVTDRGRVRDVDIVAADPEGLMDFRTRKAVKAARFRPRFVDGQPTETTDIQYRHSFVYYADASDG